MSDCARSEVAHKLRNAISRCGKCRKARRLISLFTLTTVFTETEMKRGGGVKTARAATVMVCLSLFVTLGKNETNENIRTVKHFALLVTC